MISFIKKYSYFIEKDLTKLPINDSFGYFIDFKMKPKIKKPKLIKNTSLYVVRVIVYNQIHYFYSEKISSIQIEKFNNKHVWRIIFN